MANKMQDKVIWQKAWKLIDDLLELKDLPDRGFCLYVLKYKNRYKIGKSKEPYQRFINLQHLSPVRIELIAEMRHPAAQIIEKTLHTILQEFNVWGEWFDIDEFILATLLDKMRIGDIR